MKKVYVLVHAQYDGGYSIPLLIANSIKKIDTYIKRISISFEKENNIRKYSDDCSQIGFYDCTVKYDYYTKLELYKLLEYTVQ